MISQLELLDNILYLINKINKNDDYKRNYDEKFHNEITEYYENKILINLSEDKINFDLSILKEKFNIKVNKTLLKDKSLYFLYEYICYNIFPDDKDFIKLLLLRIFDLHTYSNIIYLNNYHLNGQGILFKIMNYIGLLNILNNDQDEYYIYTDTELSKCDIEKVFDINANDNIIEINKKIYINDKFFLDYIDIPRYIIIHYNNDDKINDYFNDYYVLTHKNICNNNDVFLFLISPEFDIIEPYSVRYNFIIYFELINYYLCLKNKKRNHKKFTEEYKILSKITQDIIVEYVRIKNNYNEFPIDEFNDTNIDTNKLLHYKVIEYFYPFINKIDEKNQKDIIIIINNFIKEIYEYIIQSL